MNSKYKCYITQELLKVGDIVVRPIQGTFEKHVVVRFTKQSMYISRRVKSPYYDHVLFHKFEDDVSLHDSCFYVTNIYFIKIGEYYNDLDVFKHTLQYHLKQLKTQK